MLHRMTETIRRMVHRLLLKYAQVNKVMHAAGECFKEVHELWSYPAIVDMRLSE